MKSTSLVISAAVAAALVPAAAFSGALAKIPRGTRVHAALSARQEVPPVNRPKASGDFHALIYKQKGRLRLSWSLNYKRVTGRRATAARIHLGKPGTNGKVLVPLCPSPTDKTCGIATGGLIKISATISRLLRSGKTYINVYTKNNPKGEIRGQITLGK